MEMVGHHGDIKSLPVYTRQHWGLLFMFLYSSLHPDVIANVIDSVKVMLEMKDVEIVAMVIIDHSQCKIFIFPIC